MGACVENQLMKEHNVIEAAAVRQIPPITILIVTMDRRDLLEKTLWYIYETSTDDERDIWVWDNASEDDTPDFLGTLVSWPGVRVFRSKVDLGVAGPRRRMLPHVKTPYVFTLDDDMWLLNRGWASGVSRILAADPSVCQVALGPMPHYLNDYGISHEKLDRPFFHVPQIQPGPKGDTSAPSSRDAPHGAKVVDVAGETYVVPVEGTQLPFSCSGGAAAWRTADVLPIVARVGEHPVSDLREVWSFPMQRERGMREATAVGYGMVHPSPGPIWHLGRGERYWEERCRFAAAVYNRSAETQRAWLERTRAISGWGRPLDDPDDVLK